MTEKQKKRSYTQEFKLEAIRLYESTGKSQAETEQDLGITAGLLSKWISRYRQDEKQAFPGKGKQSKREEEIHRLQAEIRILKQEREILKKTVAIFSSPK
jgi:transposase